MASSPTKLTSVRFCVPAVPVAQPRQRHRLVHTKDDKTFVTNYTPAKDPVQAFKATVRLAARAAFGGGPTDEAVALYATFVLPRPKSKRWKTRPMERYHHAGRPDLDNLCKAILDALKGLLWVDDGQIAMATLTKVVASGDEQPHVNVTVRTLSDFEQNVICYEELTLADFEKGDCVPLASRAAGCKPDGRKQKHTGEKTP